MAKKNEPTIPTIFGQVVVGPPGSGKTTYCSHIYDYLKKIGRRALIINLGKVLLKLIIYLSQRVFCFNFRSW